jgi:hypothetical protein
LILKSALRLSKEALTMVNGHRAYLDAVEGAFGVDVDYAMLVKLYGNDREGEQCYSPAECIGCRTIEITKSPKPERISTSHVERFNLAIRMHMRRFTRLTNAHSKKIANHMHVFAIHAVYYNFARVNQALRVTPAMEAGLSDHIWSMEDRHCAVSRLKLYQCQTLS